MPASRVVSNAFQQTWYEGALLRNIENSIALSDHYLLIIVNNHLDGLMIIEGYSFF